MRPSYSQYTTDSQAPMRPGATQFLQVPSRVGDERIPYRTPVAQCTAPIKFETTGFQK